jgi:hypothetical protein
VDDDDDDDGKGGKQGKSINDSISEHKCILTSGYRLELYMTLRISSSLGNKSSASSDMSRISSASFGKLFFYCRKYDIPVPL